MLDDANAKQNAIWGKYYNKGLHVLKTKQNKT